MKVFIFVLSFLLTTIPAKAQGTKKGEISAGAGIGGSAHMGESGLTPVFKSDFSFGKKLRFENYFEFSVMDKYTKAGWFVYNGVDVLLFPSKSGLFFTGGVDYRHRNGGTWAKDGIRVGGGIGYDTGEVHARFSVKNKISSQVRYAGTSFADDVQYFPYFESLLRADVPLGSSPNLRLRVEVEAGFFNYIQNNFKRTAFYTNTVFGV